MEVYYFAKLCCDTKELTSGIFVVSDLVNSTITGHDVKGTKATPSRAGVNTNHAVVQP